MISYRDVAYSDGFVEALLFGMETDLAFEGCLPVAWLDEAFPEEGFWEDEDGML